jgi:hypothetical protein
MPIKPNAHLPAKSGTFTTFEVEREKHGDCKETFELWSGSTPGGESRSEKKVMLAMQSIANQGNVKLSVHSQIADFLHKVFLR